MYITVETFQVSPENEQEFERIWSLWVLENRFVLQASGARLHRSVDNKFISYMEWDGKARWKESRGAALLSQRMLEKVGDLVSTVSWELVEDCLKDEPAAVTFDRWQGRSCFVAV